MSCTNVFPKISFDFFDKSYFVIKPNEDVLVCLSGRGDKDVNTVAETLGEKL